MNNLNLLHEEFNNLGIQITDKQINQFSDYFDLLIEWNEKMNLTAITDEIEVIHKHFIDSVSIMKFSSLENSKLLDLGTGAGFPGIPLAILNSNCDFYLLDSLNKRVNFLNEVISVLDLKNVKAIHGRAEDYGFNEDYREKFDFVTSRAVANLATLSEYCLPFVKVGGFFVSYKSGHCDDEVNDSIKAINILGGSISNSFNYSLNIDSINNRLIYINKIKSTSKKYPRKAGTPSRSPLR